MLTGYRRTEFFLPWATGFYDDHLNVPVHIKRTFAFHGKAVNGPLN
jgi:hypothetical protein